MTPNLSGYVPATAYRAPVASSDTLADDPAELLVSVPVRSAARRVRKASTLSSADLRSNGKHRSANGVAPADRRPEAKRTSGRHAARPGVAGGD
jgi:hypothetical protein